MVSTSNDGIMTEYLVKYGAIKADRRNRPIELLEHCTSPTVIALARI